MDAEPGPEPEPPDDLPRRPLPLRTFSNPAWFRGHQSTYGPLHFNATGGRFGAPDRALFGTLYLGTDARGAFLEAFAQNLGPGARGYVVSQNLLDRSAYVSCARAGRCISSISRRVGRCDASRQTPTAASVPAVTRCPNDGPRHSGGIPNSRMASCTRAGALPSSLPWRCSIACKRT